MLGLKLNHVSKRGLWTLSDWFHLRTFGAMVHLNHSIELDVTDLCLVGVYWCLSHEHQPCMQMVNVYSQMHYGLIMTSSKGNIFRVTTPLCGESTRHRWIPLTKASDAELWCFFFICAWTNDWTHNRDAGDLIRNYADTWHMEYFPGTEERVGGEYR